MKRISIALVVLFIPLMLCAETVRLGMDVVPRAQGVSLTVDPRADTFSGSVAVDLDVVKPSSTFRFHAEDLKISSVKVNGAEAKFEAGPQNTVTVTPANPLQTGRATMTADFTGRFNRQAVGLYKMLKGSEPYLFTQFEAIDARKAFPCWDEPEFKIPYQLTVTIPAQYDAVSNTPATSDTTSGEWETVRFAATKPLPSYLIALAVGQFDYVPINGLGVPGRVVAPKGQGNLARMAAEVTPPILAALEKYFGGPYPFEKVDLLGVPEYWAGAMENPGAITYRDTILLVDSATATPAQRRNLIRVTAHELSHMWFGDLVTMEWWDDFWLNESFADWMGDKITDQIAPELGHQVAEMGDIQSVMNTDARTAAQAIRRSNTDPRDAMGAVGVVYNKGKSVLDMFERWIGPEKFRQGVLDHLQANAFGNANAQDFWAALSRHAPKNMTTALASFIEQPGIPLVSVERAGGNKIRLSQRRYFVSGDDKSNTQLWSIPVALRYSDGRRTHTQTLLLDKPSMTATLEGTPTWIFPTADAAGYYRWTLPAADVVALARQASTVLTPKERVALLGNTASLFRSGRMNADVYLDVLSRFANDPDPQVVDALIEPLGSLRVTFDTPETHSPYAAYTRRILRPALDRIGFTPKPGEAPTVTTLRPRLIGWLVDEGQDKEVLRFAQEQARKYLADPGSVDPSLVRVALMANALAGDMALFEEYRKRFETAATPAERGYFLAALGSFERPEVRERALEYSLTGPIRVQEMFAITSAGAYATDEERQRMYDWSTSHYEAITAKLPRGFGAFTSIAMGCDEKRLEAARKFLLDEKRKSDGTERAIARATESVRECATLRNREMERVVSYLKR